MCGVGRAPKMGRRGRFGVAAGGWPEDKRVGGEKKTGDPDGQGRGVEVGDEETMQDADCELATREKCSSRSTRACKRAWEAEVVFAEKTVSHL